MAEFGDSFGFSVSHTTRQPRPGTLICDVINLNQSVTSPYPICDVINLNTYVTSSNYIYDVTKLKL